jgi:tetratricopeptide (TPR) repeat protein
MAQASPPASRPSPQRAPDGVTRLEGPLRDLLEEGMAHQRARRFREAEETYRRALAQTPDQPDALNLLATLIVGAGGAAEAVRLLRRAVALRPDEPSFRANLAGALVVLGRVDDALAEVETARAVMPQAVDVDMNHASILRRLGRVGEALALYRRIDQAFPENSLARMGIGHCQVALGRWEDAAATLRDLLVQRPNEPAVHIELAAIGVAAADPDQPARTLALAAGGQLPVQTRISLLHAAARICEDLGRYDEAVEHVQAAKKMMRADAAPDALAASVARLMSAFDEGFFADRRGHGDPSDRPVFVVGLPRTGTAVVARLLAGHPQVAAAGELLRIPLLATAMADAESLARPYPEGARELTPEAARRLAAGYLDQLRNTSAEAARVVDPLPTNFEHLGLIALLFPNAQVVHCRRDPLDLGISCYLHDFPADGAALHEFAQIARFMREHDRLMDHWRRMLPLTIHDVAYEELAAAPDRVQRRLIDAIGLPWEEHCAAAAADGAPARAILARDPVGRARHYEKHLGPLRAALGA